MAEQMQQPAPFGCRLLALVAAISLLFGGIGASVGSALSSKTPASSSSSQNVTVQESSAIIDATKKVSPAVVSITTETTTRGFFGSIQQKGGGTGFIITNDGLIATNRHVVESASTALTVITSDGKTYKAEVKAIDPLIDLALIKIDGKNLPVADLGNSDTLQVGQVVIAIGNALGEFENTVTTGVISARERAIQASTQTGSEQLENLLQTDAAINPGNSGGPLSNLSGQVIGVNTAVAGDAQGIGFAIPINQVVRAIDSYRKTGKIVRPSLGVRYATLTKDLAALNKLSVENGAILVGDATGPAIIPGSSAEKAGLREGDVITAVNSSAIDKNKSLPGLLETFSPGDQIELTIVRDGKEQKIKLKLDAR